MGRVSSTLQVALDRHLRNGPVVRLVVVFSPLGISFFLFGSCFFFFFFLSLFAAEMVSERVRVRYPPELAFAPLLAFSDGSWLFFPPLVAFGFFRLLPWFIQSRSFVRRRRSPAPVPVSAPDILWIFHSIGRFFFFFFFAEHSRRRQRRKSLCPQSD